MKLVAVRNVGTILPEGHSLYPRASTLTIRNLRVLEPDPKDGSSVRKSVKHEFAGVATPVQRVNDFSPHPAERKRVRNEFEARVDRFVIVADPLFAKRLFLLV